MNSVTVDGVNSENASTLPAEDVALLAKDVGISEAEAADRFRGQNDFLAALTKAIEGVPDRCSSSAWKKTPSADAWVAFSGEED